MALIGLALDSHSKPRQNVSMQPFILHTTTAIILCKDYLKKYTILFINSCWELSFQLGCLKLYRCAGFYVTATPTLKGSRHPFRPKMLGYVNAKNSLEHLVGVTFVNYYPWFPPEQIILHYPAFPFLWSSKYISQKDGFCRLVPRKSLLSLSRVDFSQKKEGRLNAENNSIRPPSHSVHKNLILCILQFLLFHPERRKLSKHLTFPP